MTTLIFYDGGCPLCKREISHYMKLDDANKICWIDITQNPQVLAQHDITLEAAMKRIHGVTPNNVQVTGAYAFVLMWQALPYYRYLAKFISTLRLTKPLDWVYGRFAVWRYGRRCSDNCRME